MKQQYNVVTVIAVNKLFNNIFAIICYNRNYQGHTDYMYSRY